MFAPDDADVYALAVKLRRGEAAAPERLQEELEASLRPMVRCALRSGVGLPPLVRWVQRVRPTLEPPANPASLSDQTWAAARLTHLLSAALVRHLNPATGPRRPVCETVIGN